MHLRVLIADDSALARQKLRDHLAKEVDVAIVAEAANGIEVVQALEQGGVDLVFLDIQMPELDGFGAIRTLGVARMPLTIFVTAYDQHALQAFEVRALDYLLKPFSKARFQEALGRAREQLAQREKATFRAQLEGLLGTLKAEAEPEFLERFLIRGNGHMYFVPMADVTHLEAADNYVKVHAGGKVHLLRQSLASLEAKLDPKRFVRIHRGTLVALSAIERLQPWFHGDQVVFLKDGTRLALSRNYRKNIPELG